MELELFNFIDLVMQEYELNNGTYMYAEHMIRNHFETIFSADNSSVIAVYTRIKSSASLKEKLLRNKYYLYYKNAAEALENLSDLIGITVECQFIRNEAELYKKLLEHFDLSDKSEFMRSYRNDSIFLNLHATQPQVQKNGFTIYRIDGYYLFNGNRINFELQIKSLVHRFWSEIEHEVVYKNPDFIVYDRFMKNMLGSVRDNLDVVDRQLEIIYNEISNISRHTHIGIDEIGFKMMTASSINELVNRKMKESIGFTSDFKKSASILAQYIYIHDFVNGENNNVKMVDYLEHLNYLSTCTIDFKNPLFLENNYCSEHIFNNILGNYCLSKMNIDFEWHVFFVALFSIHPGNNIEDFSEFINVIRILLMTPSWYQTKFELYGSENAKELRNYFEEVLATILCDMNTISIIHEEYLLEAMERFRNFIDQLELSNLEYQTLINSKEELAENLIHEISSVFHS